MPGRFPLAVPRAVRLVSAVWLEPKELARRSLRAELASAIRWKNPKPILNRRSLVVPKRASRTIERQLSGSSLRFRARGGATSSGAGSCPEKRRRGGSSAGWHRRQRLAQPMTTVRGGMPSPSIHCRATIWKSRTTCAFARLIRRPCWRNCERFHGRVGTTNCGSGGCLFALMRSCGAVGIERAAQRAEPEERKRRREAGKHSDEHKAARLRHAERRRRRYPVPAEDLPPLGRAVATVQYDVVVFTGISGELADPSELAPFYPQSMETGFGAVWARWRPPTLAELIKTWPARRPAGSAERSRGWWRPTLGELRIARRKAKSLERRKRSRSAD